MLVTINGHTFSTTIGSMKGVFKIPVSAARRGLIHAVAGDVVTVSVAPDTAPAEIDVPADLGAALAADLGAAEFFAGLTSSQRRGFIVPIESAKSPETRKRRVDKAVAALKARQKRP